MREFALPTELEAHEPPRTRDGVRLLVGVRDRDHGSGGVSGGGGKGSDNSDPSSGSGHGGGSDRGYGGGGSRVTHHAFTDLPDLLTPGDLLVVNTSATLPAAIRLDRLAVHFSGPSPSGPYWLVELRLRSTDATVPYAGGRPGEWFPLPGGATLTLIDRHTPRLWRARLDTDVVPYLRRHGVPIRYGYVGHDWPLSAYQTVFAGSASSAARGSFTGGDSIAGDGSRVGPDSSAGRGPSARDGSSAGGGSSVGDGSADGGSAEMPSAGRPFTTELVTRLVSRGVQIAPLVLHTGVASPEKDEPPYAERYDVPAATAALVNHARREGGRVIAVGTTVVRALETAATPDGFVEASHGWTSHVVTPEGGVRVVDGLLTGLHEPRSSHLRMLITIAGTRLLEEVYSAALAHGYKWHEFGDLNLLLP